MPYKDKKRALEYAKRWNKRYYAENKEREKQRAKKRKLEIKKWLEDFKSKLKCSKCGENHPACLEFHHKNPKEKDFNIWEANRRYFSRGKILKEIGKCEVLCANCHRKVHFERDTL